MSDAVPIRREVILAVDGSEPYSGELTDWALKTLVRPDDLVCVLQVVPCTPQHVEVLHGPVGSSYTLTKDQATELQPSSEDVIFEQAQTALEKHVLSRLKAKGIRHAVRAYRDTINASGANIGEAIMKIVMDEYEMGRRDGVGMLVVVGACAPGRVPLFHSDSFALGATADYVARNCAFPVVVHRLPGPVVAQSGDRAGKVVQVGEAIGQALAGLSLKAAEYANNTSVVAPM